MLVLTLWAASLWTAELPAHAAVSREGMVASVHPLATEAGIAVLRGGGNAIDAAVAVGLTLGVVDPHNSGLGGGCFLLIRRADGRLAAIDGRETAPSRASPQMYVREGKPQPELSQDGPLAVATPGALAAYDLALREHGRRTLGELALPAAALAESGFALSRSSAASLRGAAKLLRQFSGPEVDLLPRDGSPPEEGQWVRQPDLARTLRGIARGGTDYFYRGPVAQAVGKWMAERGGLLTEEDFAQYRPVVRPPLVTTYRGWTIVGFPPPSSGGVHVAQMLHMLETFDVAEIYQRDPVAFYHLLAEAMKLAFADRAYWLGDPDFVRVPRGLVEKEYARSLATRIDLARTTPVPSAGMPLEADSRVFDKHTTHVAVADREGNWVAMTQTINTSYGSKVMVPGTGIVLNNEMDDFAIAPGQPNAFGLVGAEANAVAPRKRPLSSMSPTIVLQQGQPILTLGAAGGPTIISQVLQTLVRTLDLQIPLPEAVAAPRIHHQWAPDSLRVENGLDEAIRQGLAARGHRLTPVARMGVCQAIFYDSQRQEFLGVHDPRTAGKAAGP